MRDLKPPTVARTHPDRSIECQAALSDSFDELVDQAIAAGWTDEEIAAALTALADNRILGIAQIAKVDALLADLKRR